MCLLIYWGYLIYYFDIRLNMVVGYCCVDKMSFYYLLESIVFIFFMDVLMIFFNGVFIKVSNEVVIVIINMYLIIVLWLFFINCCVLICVVM